MIKFSDTAEGTTGDWVYQTLKVKPSFTVEMRPHQPFRDTEPEKWLYRFILPEDEIKAASEEVFAGIEAVIKELNEMSASTTVPISIQTNILLIIAAIITLL